LVTHKQPAPTPRLFKEYFQRLFRHKSHLGYCYSAVELNISCPGGLSGSAVFNKNFHGRLYGVVTENVKTTTELESVIEIDDDGKQFKESFHNMVNYGVAVWLSDVSGWIDAHVHPVSPEEIARRSNNQQAWGDM
jgi:hypothetical protein